MEDKIIGYEPARPDGHSPNGVFSGAGGKVFINWINQFPFEETEKWGGSYLQNIAKIRKAIRKAVPDDETYYKRISEPIIATVRKTLRDGMVNKKGLPKEAILKLMAAKMKRKGIADEHWENLKKGFREFDQGDLNNAMVKHHLKKCFGVERFREAIDRANNLLTPFILPGKLGEFKKKLGNQLRRSGKLISELAYHPKYLGQENDKINVLINEYIRKGIVPFSTGGPSHCDFIPIPGSVRPADSKEVLDKKYEIYKHFYGEEHANGVRATWRVVDYSGIQIDPNDYIGHPENPAYFDMNLDVQVSRKE